MARVWKKVAVSCPRSSPIGGLSIDRAWQSVHRGEAFRVRDPSIREMGRRRRHCRKSLVRGSSIQYPWQRNDRPPDRSRPRLSIASVGANRQGFASTPVTQPIAGCFGRGKTASPMTLYWALGKSSQIGWQSKPIAVKMPVRSERYLGSRFRTSPIRDQRNRRSIRETDGSTFARPSSGGRNSTVGAAHVKTRLRSAEQSVPAAKGQVGEAADVVDASRLGHLSCRWTER